MRTVKRNTALEESEQSAQKALLWAAETNVSMVACDGDRIETVRVVEKELDDKLTERDGGWQA